MFKSLYNKFQHSRLLDKNFEFLFEKDESSEVVVFDTETTGLDTKKDEIISIAAVKVRGNKIVASEKFVRSIKPTKEVAPESVRIHQIRSVDLKHFGQADNVMRDFLHFIGARKLVGYYLEFDVAMVNRYIKPMLGITLPNEQLDVSALYYDKKIKGVPQGNIDLKFDTIMQDLGLPFLGKHDALNDAVMTAMIYIKLNTLHKL